MNFIKVFNESNLDSKYLIGIEKAVLLYSQKHKCEPISIAINEHCHIYSAYVVFKPLD